MYRLARYAEQPQHPPERPVTSSGCWPTNLQQSFLLQSGVVVQCFRASGLQGCQGSAFFSGLMVWAPIPIDLANISLDADGLGAYRSMQALGFRTQRQSSRVQGVCVHMFVCVSVYTYIYYVSVLIYKNIYTHIHTHTHCVVQCCTCIRCICVYYQQDRPVPSSIVYSMCAQMNRWIHRWIHKQIDRQTERQVVVGSYQAHLMIEHS